MTARLSVLIGVTAIFWLVVAFPAHWIWGEGALPYSATAMALCLIPASLSLMWSLWASRQPDDKQLTMILGGTGIRLFGALATGYGLYQFVPYFNKYQTPGFLIWVGVFYLFTLALETALSLIGRPMKQPPPEQPSLVAPAAPQV